ncbi:uncharacterized protein LOC144031256 [Festucalex cinctus]
MILIQRGSIKCRKMKRSWLLWSGLLQTAFHPRSHLSYSVSMIRQRGTCQTGVGSLRKPDSPRESAPLAPGRERPVKMTPSVAVTMATTTDPSHKCCCACLQALFK